MSRPLELILARQWCALLAVPVLLFDHEAVLVFYNEPAEVLLGRKFDEAGSMVPHEWATAFAMENAEGERLDATDTPMSVSLRDGRPTQRAVAVRGYHGLKRDVVVTAFPIKGLEHKLLGAMALIDAAG